MRVIIFGATGMVGQSVLRECLIDPQVTAILVIGRSPVPAAYDKVIQIVHDDFLDFTSIGPELAGYDACFFCLGVSAAGMSEPAYRRVTYFTTMAAARELADRNPTMRFLYISGAGTDSTEHGRLMWARVKGETENAVLSLPFDGYALRPGYIQPRYGVQSKNRLYRNMYRVTGSLYPVLRRVAAKYVIGSDELARAMLSIAANGARQRILESADLLRRA
ncbi:NAD(P)H-binding protein [Nakamurella panacisegetis]